MEIASDAELQLNSIKFAAPMLIELSLDRFLGGYPRARPRDPIYRSAAHET